MAFSLSDLFQFNPDGSYVPASNFVAPSSDGFDPATYAQNDQGQVIGWSPSETSRRGLIDQAYANQQNGNNNTTSFANFGQPPQQLGNDVISALATGGLWMPPGSDVSGSNRNIQANRLDDGSIMVSDPRGGDGSNPNYYYDSTGKFQKTGVGSKIMSGAQGILSVAGAAAGFGALGTLAGGGSLGLSQMGSAAGLVPKNLAPDIMGSSPNIPQPSFGQSNMPNSFSASLGGLSSLFSGGQSGGGNMASGDGSFQDTLSKLFSGGQGGLGGLLGSLGGLGNIGANLAPGLVDANQKNQAGQSMIDFLNQQQNTMQQQGQTAQKGLMDFINGQQSKIDGLYNPGTPEANLLQQQMEAKDAAAGRNSQYGPRSVDLAAKLAGLKGGLDAQFAGSAIPAVNNSLNQAASNTNSFTTGTSKALADALGVKSGAFNSLLAGLGALNQRSQQGGGGVPPGIGQVAGGIGSLSNLFNGTFGNNINDALTGGLGSLPFGSGFNFGSPTLDANGIGSFGSAGGTGIGFGNFGTGLDAFSGQGFNDVSDIADWFL